MNNMRNVTGKNIRRERIRMGLSTDELSKRLAKYGVSLSKYTIPIIEDGKREVWDYELSAFAKALEVPLETLFDTEK